MRCGLAGHTSLPSVRAGAAAPRWKWWPESRTGEFADAPKALPRNSDPVSAEPSPAHSTLPGSRGYRRRWDRGHAADGRCG